MSRQTRRIYEQKELQELKKKEANKIAADAIIKARAARTAEEKQVILERLNKTRALIESKAGGAKIKTYQELKKAIQDTSNPRARQALEAAAKEEIENLRKGGNALIALGESEQMTVARKEEAERLRQTARKAVLKEDSLKYWETLKEKENEIRQQMGKEFEKMGMMDATPQVVNALIKKDPELQKLNRRLKEIEGQRVKEYVKGKV